MKQYLGKKPVLVVGGTARAFLGEYMAGGLIVLLTRNGVKPFDEQGIASGIHGGEIFIRGDFDEKLLGVGARKLPCNSEDMDRVIPFIREFAQWFNLDEGPLMEGQFYRITPASSRPFANKYTWE